MEAITSIRYLGKEKRRKKSVWLSSDHYHTKPGSGTRTVLFRREKKREGGEGEGSS